LTLPTSGLRGWLALRVTTNANTAAKNNKTKIVDIKTPY